MLGVIEGVRIISSHQNKSKAYGKVQDRATNGFIFKIKGASVYNIGGEVITLGEGEMIFLPKGASYEYRTENHESSLYLSINFLADIEKTEVEIFSLEGFYKLGYIYQSFYELWCFGDAADKYACLSVFYELLAYIAKAEHTEEDRSKYCLIAPAVEYMKKHIYDSAFRVDRLHAQCGISDTYFRKIFKSRFGMTPKEYVLKERLSHARSIIESGDFGSIREVAEMVGFSDALYFGKAFKSLFGMPPSKVFE